MWKKIEKIAEDKKKMNFFNPPSDGLTYYMEIIKINSRRRRKNK